MRGGVAEGPVGGSGFWWFLGGFGWFLLVDDNFGLFHMVCCFSSFTNFAVYRRVNYSLFSWSHVIGLCHSIFLFKVKLQDCCLVALQSENKWLFLILYCVVCQIKNFFWGDYLNQQLQNTKLEGVLRNV